MAADYLTGKGYVILRKNYRYKKAEIDLIAEREKELVFVEVKYRKSNAFGYPEEFVSERKEELVRSAAENYLSEKGWTGDFRFDIVSITKGVIPDIEHFEDAF